MNLEPFTFVLERLDQLLVDEIWVMSTDEEKLLGNLNQQVELAQSFVRDVEEENQLATISHVLETEILHIMLILTQIEDFLDTLYQKEVQQSQQQNSCNPKFMACFSYISNLLVQKHLVIDIAIKLTYELQATRQRAEPYKQQSNRPQVTQRRRPQTQPHIINDDFIVGLEEDTKNLVAKLVGNNGEHTTILAIVGMGGSGKTTLARKLYNHKHIIRHFTGCRAWVCVSQEWDTTQLLLEICVQAHVPLAEGETSIASHKLQEFLKENSCLVVLDDVWEGKALQELLPLLLQEDSGNENGRVLVTTRNQEFLNYPTLSGVYIHKARCLTHKESWDLFSNIVHNKRRGTIRSFDDESKFAELGKELLKRCLGLPLAIIVLAGLLSEKDTIQEWETLKSIVMPRILRQNKVFYDYGLVREMLELSYFDLPYALKPCFLYLGIFPEDSLIYRDELTQLWIGEGFLRVDMCNEGQTLEELGRDFLDELIQRNMVQVSSRDYERKVEEIQLHDLMRDLCIEKAKELRFFMETMSSRAIMYKSPKRDALLLTRNSRLRSFIYFQDYSGVTSKLELSVSILNTMELLRVLHLEKVDLKDSIELIGNMRLLRYLTMKKCFGVKQLPGSIKNLRNLVTFTFDGDLEADEGIPTNMVFGMEHLVYFSLFGKVTSSTTRGMYRLSKLQTLRVSASEWLTKELWLVTSLCLRVLEIEGIYSQEQLEALYDFVSNTSSHLYELYLSLQHVSGLEFELEKLKLESPQILKHLYLEGKIRKQQPYLLFPQNLMTLDLDNTQIDDEEDLKIALAELRELRSLKLKWDSYLADKLTMVGLPQLQVLTLSNLSNLKEWSIKEEGSLLQLKKLELFDCDKLERIPKEISCIRTLQSFRATFMSVSFCKRLQRPSEKEGSSEGSGGGEDFHLIQHISSIFIDDGEQLYA